jgi:hypothetical protein
MKTSSIHRPTVTNAEEVIPDMKRGDKTLSEIIEAIKDLLKPYRKNLSIGIEMSDDQPYIIRINYEIFLK